MDPRHWWLGALVVAAVSCGDAESERGGGTATVTGNEPGAEGDPSDEKTPPPGSTSPTAGDPSQPPTLGGSTVPATPPTPTCSATLTVNCLARAGAPRVVLDAAPSGTAAVVAGANAFAFDLYAEVAGGGGNVLFSPFSITTAFAMAWAGAAGDTATEIADVMHFTEPEATTHDVMNYLDTTFSTSPNVAIRVANSFWVATDVTPAPAFLDLLAASYGSGVGVVDFTQTEAARILLNGWVAENTANRIPELIPPGVITSNTKAALINALQLDAKWAAPFSKDETYDGRFERSDGSVVDVPFMEHEAWHPYVDGDGYQAVALSYEDPSFEMIAILPDGPITDFEATLDERRFEAIASSLSGQTVFLSMPKLELRAPTSLKPVLQDMGMRVPFMLGAADFSRMIDTDVPIQDVLHEAFLRVDEEGTEAAAATVILFGDASVSPLQPPSLFLDRPFVIAIRHRDSGALLFLGRVSDPS